MSQHLSFLTHKLGTVVPRVPIEYVYYVFPKG